MFSENNMLEKQRGKIVNDLIKIVLKQFNFRSITPEEIWGGFY